MNNTPKITVIIPAYNGERFIRETLGYIKNQRFGQFECIIIDDGSTDKTNSVIKDSIEGDDRFTLITQKNQGKPSSLNRGLSMAKGEYVIMLDHDDIFHDDMLDNLYDTAVSRDAEIVVCDFRNFHENTKTFSGSALSLGKLPKGVFSINDMEKDSFFSQPLYPSCYNKLWSRKFINEHDLVFDGNAWPAEDELFETVSLLQAKRIVVLDKVLIDYRVSDDQITANRITNYQDASFYAYQEIYKKISNSSRGKKWIEPFRKLILGFTVGFIDLSMDTTDFNLQEKIYRKSQDILRDTRAIDSERSSLSKDYREKLAIITKYPIGKYYNYLMSLQDSQISKLSSDLNGIREDMKVRETVGIKKSAQLFARAVKRRAANKLKL